MPEEEKVKDQKHRQLFLSLLPGLAASASAAALTSLGNLASRKTSSAIPEV
jgi:hypothetical protein